MTLEYLETMEMENNEKKTASPPTQSMEDSPTVQSLEASPAKVAPGPNHNPLPRRLRGTLTIKAHDDMEFRADRQTGLSSQQEIATDGLSKLYHTVGEKKKTMVMHAVAPADCPDPRAYFMEKVERLTEGMQTKAKPKLRGMKLLETDDLSVTFQKKERVIEATLRIRLEQYPAYNNRLINLMQMISQCFASNQTTFLKQSR